MTRRINLRTLASGVALAVLGACGGGGGSPEAQGPPAAPLATTASVQPGAGMQWNTSTSPVLTLHLRDAQGGAVARGAVRVFIASARSPHDGSLLDAAVPTTVVETAMSDAQGRVDLPLRLPAHTAALLVVATDGDREGRRELSMADLAGPIELTLAR